MAAYKNREVTVEKTYVPSNTNVEVIAVAYTNGMKDHVPLSQVSFTADEKKDLLKAHPSKFEHVSVVSESDLKSIREGIEPSLVEEVKLKK